MKQYEKVLKILANGRRLEILKFLKNKKESTVGSIASHIKLSFKSTSKHLGLLMSVDLVDKEQRSTSCFYRISERVPTISKAVILIL